MDVEGTEWGAEVLQGAAGMQPPPPPPPPYIKQWKFNAGDGKSETVNKTNINNNGVRTAWAGLHCCLMLGARAGVCAKPGHMAEIIIILIKQLDGHLCSATMFPPEKR